MAKAASSLALPLATNSFSRTRCLSSSTTTSRIAPSCQMPYAPRFSKMLLLLMPRLVLLLLPPTGTAFSTTVMAAVTLNLLLEAVPIVLNHHQPAPLVAHLPIRLVGLLPPQKRERTLRIGIRSVHVAAAAEAVGGRAV